MEPRTAVACARARMPVLWLGLALIIAKLVAGDHLGAPWPEVLTALGGTVFVVGMALYLRIGTVRGEPVPLDAPVSGRWLALNSPAGKVPSHGVHAYGQTYALDVVHDPTDRPRPAFGWWPPARRAEHFPAFGRPVLAPADGTVVRVHDRERDHWSRNSWLALPYLLVEASLRELLGPGRILGNHLVIDIGDGRYVVMAHLRRRSVRVAAGDPVIAGQRLASCGNSGNSTEPHLHFQVMDHPRILFAAGLPFRFSRYRTDDGVRGGVPRGGQAFIAPSGVDSAAG
ncbi:MAG TPA: M23 family metallopeptidase [Mycobacteriales bacterium]|nr:M23 family metallopeptidase [Mycobacteriales bacterium]